MVTDAQVSLLRQRLMEKTQETAAATAGMSARSARRWQEGPLPSQTKSKRSWRTRVDAFTAVWASFIVPLLVADTKRILAATTVVALLAAKHPGQFGAPQVRTLQRRIRDWRAVNGPEQEVYFEQEHVDRRQLFWPVGDNYFGRSGSGCLTASFS
jgi:hypothetical protein